MLSTVLGTEYTIVAIVAVIVVTVFVIISLLLGSELDLPGNQ